MQPPEEQNDPVWELLKQARQTKASPFFSRNVVREIRKLESNPASGGVLSACLSWLRRPVIAGGLVAAALVVTSVVIAIQLTPGTSKVPSTVAQAEIKTPTPVETEFDPASEIGDLEYLGQLMAVTDPSLLDDAALADLLF